MNTYTKEYFHRPLYYSRIKPFIDTDIIKVLVGQRRVGKSYILYEIMNTILETHPKANIIYINKELSDFDPIQDYRDLLQYVKTHSDKRKKCYLFIDEIQGIHEFERALRSLFAEGGYDIYCTGSNACLLSGELATYLTGRYIEIKVNALTYTEFLNFHNLADSPDSFEKFYKYGGLPYLVNLQLEDDIVYEYAQSTYNSILLKDVVARYNLRNVRMLNDLTTYLADNIGTIFSAPRISQFLKSQRIDLSNKVILEYLLYLETAFLIKRVKRADVKGKKIFEIGEKYYFEDLGIRHSLIRYKKTDQARVLENIVYQHLEAHGYKVYIGKLDCREIDFIAEKNSERTYIQVCTYLTEEKTIEREFGNLLDVKDNYPKLVVTLEEGDGGTYKGIPIIGIRKFLTEWGYKSKIKPYPTDDYSSPCIVSEAAIEYLTKQQIKQLESIERQRISPM